MTFVNISSSFSILSNNKKVIALEKTLQQSLQEIQELLTDFEQLHIISDNYKAEYSKQKEICESNSCSSAETLKKVIKSKDKIIESVASTLTKLVETKDLKVIDNIFGILFGDITPQPYQDNIECNDNKKTSPINIKKELTSSNEDLSFKNESMSEIEGTPTGRTSPIIQTKKIKNSIVSSSDFRDKKKCPESWPTPEKKSLKLTFSTPSRGKQNGKMRQARLNIVKVKENSIIDITCSPEFSGGCRTSKNCDSIVQPLIKKESMENDDTILPSPTSGPTNFNLFKSKESPKKFKKPLSLKVKTENTKKTPKKHDRSPSKLAIKQEPNSENRLISDFKINDSVTYTQDDSINLLNPKRLPNNFLKQSPTKQERSTDETYCDTQSSVSLLHHVNQLEDIHKEGKQSSPSKSPLAENINVTNMADDVIQPSMSLLQPNKVADENFRRRIPELMDVTHDGPVRKKADKRLLPGWSCDKCKEFFSELYKDDPEMMAKKINECSHHRGVNNPTDRPKTPPGYWNPRWAVPDNTEEFNRMNNVT